MKSLNLITTAVCLSFLMGCTNDSQSDLIDSTPVPTIVTYTNTVKSIIDGSCISCHGSTPTNGASLSLTTYTLVKDAVTSHGLIDRISRSQGTTGMMPKDGTRLPQPTIDKVIKWQTDGLSE